MLDAYNAIANGGVFVEPKLVRGYVYPDGADRRPPHRAPRTRCSRPSVDATMVKMLEQVVLDGTGTDAIIPGYSVAGKTGTATIPFPGKDQLDRRLQRELRRLRPGERPRAVDDRRH